MGWICVSIEVLVAYVLVDAASGVYHLVTDKGFNTINQIRMFQEHHRTNTMEGFDWQTFAVGMPIAVVGAWIHSAFLIAIGVFVALTQVTHYYAHKNSRNKLVHHCIRVLQLSRLIVSKERHATHHCEPFDKDFCLLSGWNNLWMNWILDKWRSQSQDQLDLGS